tara:strand:- start:172 stop:1344 length:1173 start_codon:yes stop_codon:yes gene_type:complete
MGASASINTFYDEEALASAKRRNLESETIQNQIVEDNFEEQKQTTLLSSFANSPNRMRSMTALDDELTMRLRDHILSAFSGNTNKKVLKATFRLHEKFAENVHNLPLDDKVCQLIKSWGLLNANDFLALRTDGDGNCLVHSVSLAMFGSHDRNSLVRTLLSNILNNSVSEIATLMESAWKQDAVESDLMLTREGIDIRRTSSALDREYDSQLRIASQDKEYLGSFHILALSHALRRPIIVYSDKFVRGRDSSALAMCDMGGVYLPLGLDPAQCCQIPLVLVFISAQGGGSGHFVPLVSFATKQVFQIPLQISIKGAGGDSDSSREKHDLPIRYTSGDWYGGTDGRVILSQYLPKGSYYEGGTGGTIKLAPDGNFFMLEESIALQQKFLDI